MPAYGDQVIPGVPNMISPIVPVADDTVPNLVGSIGNAGLAAFVSRANHAGQLALQEKQLQQQAVLDAQHTELKREAMAQDFQLTSRKINLDRELGSLSGNAQAEYMKDLRGFAEQMRSFKGDRRSAEYAAYTLDALYSNPLTLKSEAGVAAYKAATQPHDDANDVRATIAAQRKAMGLTPDAPVDIRTTTDSKGGTKVTVSTPKTSRAGMSPAEKQAAKDEEELLEARAVLDGHQKAADAERDRYVTLGKAGKSKDNTENVPYSKSAAMEIARAKADRLEKKLRGRKQSEGFKEPDLPVKDTSAQDTPEAVKAAFDSGTIDRAEAERRLKALGFTG